MEHIVNGCVDCPFKNRLYDGWGTAECNHPEIEGEDISDYKGKNKPQNCPLKQQPITIKLKED